MSRDRHLKLRHRTYFYIRKKPKDIAASGLDPRPALIEISLKTHHAPEARLARDRLEQEDDRRWQAMRDMMAVDASRRWQGAADLFGEVKETDYRLMTMDQRHDIIERAVKAHDDYKGDIPSLVRDAVLGRIDRPAVMVSMLARFYFDDIHPLMHKDKSEPQRERAERWFHIASRHLVAVVGDKKVTDLTKLDGQRFHKAWVAKLGQLNKRTGKPFTPDAANREFGCLRRMVDSYFRYMDFDRKNPFNDFSFEEKTVSRRSYDNSQLGGMLSGEALLGLGRDARAVFLVCLETGARLGEVCNLRPNQIHLNAEIPYIQIAPEGRELKTHGSERGIPLVGVALAAMKAYPQGWKQFHDKENSVASRIGKYLRENKLVQTGQGPNHSLRHNIKDRLREAEVEERLIDSILGHGEREVPKYGEGFSLRRKRDALEKVALPFGEAILRDSPVDTRKKLTARKSS